VVSVYAFLLGQTTICPCLISFEEEYKNLLEEAGVFDYFGQTRPLISE